MWLIANVLYNAENEREREREREKQEDEEGRKCLKCIFQSCIDPCSNHKSYKGDDGDELVAIVIIYMYIYNCI